MGRGERRDERAARHVVSVSLGVAVERFEDGSEPAQVDACFTYPDGRTAALEVVGDHDSDFNAQWTALNQVDHKLLVPGLMGAWTAQLSRRARVRDVARDLPALAVRWQYQLPEVNTRRQIWEGLPDRFESLGVSMFYRYSDEPPGLIRLMTEGWTGIAGDPELATFVERVLAEQADVPTKLARFPADEQHAFLWTTSGSDFEAQFALENRDQRAPTVAPDLPAGVTHVWVAGSFTSQGALAWFPDRGWWRTPFVWPNDGPLSLDVD